MDHKLKRGEYSAEQYRKTIFQCRDLLGLPNDVEWDNFNKVLIKAVILGHEQIIKENHERYLK